MRINMRWIGYTHIDKGLFLKTFFDRYSFKILEKIIRRAVHVTHDDSDGRWIEILIRVFANSSRAGAEKMGPPGT